MNARKKMSPQLGIGRHDLQKLVAVDFEHFAGYGRRDASEESSAGQDRPLSGEHPGAEADGQVLRRLNGVLRKRIHLAGHDHKNLGDRLTRLADHLALRELTTVPVRLEAMQLHRGELREGLVFLRAGVRGCGNCRGCHMLP